MAALTRDTARLGQPVTVHLRRGDVVAGVLDAWSAQFVTVRSSTRFARFHVRQISEVTPR